MSICLRAYKFKQSPSSIFVTEVLQQPVPRPCWNRIWPWHCAHCWETNPDNYTSRPKVAAFSSIHPSPGQALEFGPCLALGSNQPGPVNAPPPPNTQTDLKTAGVSSQVLLTCTLLTCRSRCNLAGLLLGQKKVCGHKERQREVTSAKGRYVRL